MRLTMLLFLTAGLGFGATWSGALVDAGCYAAKERNVSPSNEDYNVNRDRSEEIRYCSPGSKTKSFAVVELDGESFKLDARGNTKAAELVRTSVKNSPLVVAVTGAMNKNTVTVDSISVASGSQQR